MEVVDEARKQGDGSVASSYVQYSQRKVIILHIESMIPKDISGALELWRKIPWAEASLSGSDEPEELKKFLQKNPNTCLVMKEKGNIIGTVLGGYDGRRGYVYHLAIFPTLQGNGYGRMLIDELLSRFKSIGVHKVHLFVFNKNHNAMGFYKNLEWEYRDDIDIFSKSLK